MKYKKHTIANRIFNVIGGLLLAFTCFFCSFLFYKNSEIDLKNVDKFEGQIIDRGITAYYTSTSAPYKYTFIKNVFYLKIKGLDQILGVYNTKQFYTTLENNLLLGDTILVHYKKSKQVNKLNLATIQIEKNKRIVLNSKEFKGKESLAFYLSFLGGCLLLTLIYFNDKKFR